MNKSSEVWNYIVRKWPRISFKDLDTFLDNLYGEVAVKRKRKTIGSAVRMGIFNRDNNKCLRCGEDDMQRLTIDHVVPFSKGGEDNINNYQTLCDECNQWKADKIMDYRKN